MAGATGKRLTGIILFILAAISVAAFLFLLFADAEGLGNVPGTEEIPNIALIAAIGLGVVALVLLILLIVRTYDRKDVEAEMAEAFFIPEAAQDDFLDFAEVDEEDVPPSVAEDEWLEDDHLELEGVAPCNLWEVPLGSHAWGATAVDGTKRTHSFHYPREEARGLYNNDYVAINADGDQVKIRTLLAAPRGAFDGMSDDPVRGPQPAAEPAAAPTQEEIDELESRLAARSRSKPAPTKAKAPKVSDKPTDKPAAYYDYAGDVHDVIDVEGIGPVYAKRLNAIGVKTTARLCYEDPESLARSIQASEKSVVAWQQMAELMRVNGIGPQYAEALVRAGIDGIAPLRKGKADTIAAQVNAYLAGLEVNVIGQKITAKRVEGWQAKAKPMRKTRRAIPEA